MKKTVLFALIYCISLAMIGCSGNQNRRKNKQEVRKDNFKKVVIGTQTWMTENMAVSTFRTGEKIFHAKSIEEWKGAGEKKQPAWCYYENDPKNGTQFGKLYNYYALTDPRGLAPKGWHIPTELDWKKLETQLGKNPGIKMKSASGWNENGNGTNESGFLGLPGGYRGNDGSFYFQGQNGYWWISSNTKTKNVVCCNLNYKYNYLIRLTATKETGFSVRCLKD
jgi:uncharacterized protein (TIGR02145 family)